MKNAYFLFILICINACSETPETNKIYVKETVPDPKVRGDFYVSDPDNFLSESEEASIESELSQLKRTTTDEMAVVVLNSIGDESIVSFKDQLFNYWAIGDKTKNNGLLMLIVMNQRRVEIETGYGIEGVLPDGVCKNILDNEVVPFFKEEEYGKGILAGVKTISLILNKPDNKEFINSYANGYSSSKNPYSYEAIKDREALEIFKWIAATVLLCYWLILFSVYKRKRKKNEFYHLYNNLQENSQSKVSLPVSLKRWIFVYAIFPAFLVFYLWATSDVGMFIFSIYGYFCFLFFDKRIRTNSFIARAHNDSYDQYKKLGESHNLWQFCIFLFPVPFIFYWVWYGFKKGILRNTPRDCSKCGKKTIKLGEKEDDAHLSKSQMLEENLRSVDYDVWVCKDCSTHEVLGYESFFSKYNKCASCGTKAEYMVSDRTISSATYESTGQGLKSYLCKSCNRTHEVTYVIPMLERSDSSSSSSSGSSGSSGSWGGGSSGGGGAGSSW